MSLGEVTLCLSYYRNCDMLKLQVQKWQQYPSKLRIIVVDDGSPEPAKPIIEANASADLLNRIQLYRIMVDVPWNREEARNLAAMKTETEWLIQIDIDHVLPWSDAHELLRFTTDPKHWYRFHRWRVGKADETRKKDVLKADVEFGKIHPHLDSFLVTKRMYWDAGGYNEDFSGCLGGGSAFIKQLSNIAEPRLLPESVALHVYTRSEVKDASDWSLSRDRTEGKIRAKQLESKGKSKGSNPLRHPWERQL